MPDAEMSRDLQIYELKADVEQFRWLEVKHTTMDPMVLLLQGQPLGHMWRPPVVQEVLDDELPAGPVSDFPYMEGAPTFSSRAVAALSDLLEPNGELLPIQYSRSAYFVFNVTRIVDALDESRSEVERFSGSGRIKRILRFAFIPDAVAGLTIFKIPQMLKPLVLVTGMFKSRVESAGLSGFVFQSLWPNRNVK